jgi:hypothetical protein
LREGAGNRDAGARSVFTARQRLALLAAFALLLVFRLPHVWAHGRFQDEEATVFLAYAWHYPWVNALFRPFAGYLNLGATAPTVLVAQLVKSGVLPLERAPYVTMSIALAVQLLPAVLILTGRGEWLAHRLAVIAALLMIAIAPATEEVFFNVMHIQFHLALCAALILALDVPRRRLAQVGYCAILFAAPLCGPGAIVLVPLFPLRSLLDRDFARLIQTVLLAASAAIQLLLFFGTSPVRAHILDPVTTAAAMFVRLVTLPFLGPSSAYRAAAIIYDSKASGGATWWLFAVATCIIFGVIGLQAARRRDSAIWLLLSAVAIGAASIRAGIVTTNAVDAFSVYGGERYNFLPDVLIGLTLVALATRNPFRHQPVYAVLCGMMLFVGAVCYSEPLKQFADGPSWRSEVDAWRADHKHALAVWPAPWTADLSDETHRCSSPDAGLVGSKDPRYCESGWVAGFYRAPVTLPATPQSHQRAH